MRKNLRCAPIVWAAGLLLILGAARTVTAADDPPSPSFSPESVAFFEAKVRPILVEKCLRCHGDRKQSSGLRLDSRAAVLAGGGIEGPAVEPGDPESSPLVMAVRHSIETKMPPDGKLGDDEQAALAEWVRLGAPWSSDVLPTPDRVAGAAETHWAFQPVRAVEPPAVASTEQIATPIDAFLLARLESAGLGFAPPADRRTLIRRVTFDLTGLPPSPEEVEAFLADPAPDAYERLVGRLLASPHYGERQARLWLDVARYADTKGYVFQEERRYPFAYTYRDWVVRAFHDDMPYDQFLVRQIAADRLDGDDPAHRAALGFLTVGRRFLNNQQDIIDDRIDVVTRGLMGLTVACARCHDHKFDPIPTTDYYALYGVFASTVEPAEGLELPGASEGPAADDFRRQLAERQAKVQDFQGKKRSEIRSDLIEHFAEYALAAREAGEAARGPKLDDAARRWTVEARRVAILAEAVASRRDDPWAAAWLAIAKLPDEGFATAVVDRLRDESIAAEPRRFFGEPPVASFEEAARRLGARLAAASKPEAAGDDPLRGWIDPETGAFAISAGDVSRQLNRAERNELRELTKQVAALVATHPAAPPRAMGVADAPTPTNPRVFIRGNPGRPGPEVPRRFVTVLSGPESKPFTDGSGRLELARAIASPTNPLTVRTAVNRVWAQHFGRGLVDPPGDLGTRGEPPSHPELLDWLAARFVADGWSIKSLHRLIVRSTAYRQSTTGATLAADDPENRLLGRQNRRRLDFESLRDALLAASGRLDPAIGGRSLPLFDEPFTGRRTLYGFIDRQNLDGTYRTFDFASPDATAARRSQTTVPQQGLFLLNSPFVAEQAAALAARVESEGGPAAGRVDRLFRLALGRPPTETERALVVEVLRGREARPAIPLVEVAQALFLTNEFLYID